MAPQCPYLVQAPLADGVHHRRPVQGVLDAVGVVVDVEVLPKVRRQPVQVGCTATNALRVISMSGG
eukprot:5886013-Pyramimonas_sp.AAC.1